MICKNCGLEIKWKEETVKAKWTMPAFWIHVESGNRYCILQAEPMEEVINNVR